ncbi:calsyntenin-3-like isoform X2 [Narcine bancroftii]|uniref:calsyntenin-3-like isoform X2 n=1 Tax=Narcine bancroftii TaxID=1343680 RepID=UPI003831034D
MWAHIWPGVVCSLLAAMQCSKASNKHKPWIEAEYQGIVMENDRTVLLNPPLFAIDKDAPLRYSGEICGFKIHGQNVPFEVLVVDKVTGEGSIRAKQPVDCELQREHTFTIQAQDCGDNAHRNNVKRSHKAIVRLRVNDVNEFAPVFDETLYKVSVTEGAPPGLLLRVEARDGDCSPQYSQICFYEILTSDVPFSVDNDGNIRNTAELVGGRGDIYTFTVTAYDCGKKRAAQDARVEVEVRPACTPGWQGWTKRVDYVPGSGPRPLFPHIHLEMCRAPVGSVEARVELRTAHVAKGCDRDNYSERMLRRLCGASEDEVVLLPAVSSLSNWTQGLATFPSQDTSQIYWFNGSQAVDIPLEILPLALSESLTLSFWMKNNPLEKSPGASNEETVICHTLRTDNGYAHYTLSILGPRVLLQYWPQLQSTHPVKFRWQLDQACDQDWHHYSLSLNPPTALLSIDGTSYEPAVILESGRQRATIARARMVIGACWKASQDEPLVRHLRAFMAGLSVRAGTLEPRQVRHCLYSCREGLDFLTFDSLAQGMKIHINPSQTLLVLEGDDVDNINRAIEHVTYRNVLHFATPGVRPLRLTTTVQCRGEGPCPHLPPVEARLHVLPPEAPRLELSGERHLARPAADFEGVRGVALFPGVRLSCSLGDSRTSTEGLNPTEGDPLGLDGFIHSLDSCEVYVLGDTLHPSQDALLLDPGLLQGKGLHVSNTSSGLTISGVQSTGMYERLLRDVRYRLALGTALYERQFRVLCAEMSGRYTSNEFTVEVTLLHSLALPPHPSHLQAGQQFLLSAHRGRVGMDRHRVPSAHRASVVPGAATIIILVCVAFLVLMVVLGIFRIRSLHPVPRRGQEGEAFWDDTALTIIVNPMESHGQLHCVGVHDSATPGSSGQDEAAKHQR